MEKKISKAYLLYGISVIVTFVCFALIIFNIIKYMKGEMIISALLMLVTWTPCIGMVILEVAVYIWGIHCMKNIQKQRDLQKQGKYPWIFGIVSNFYMVGFGLVYLCTNFQTFRFYLIMTILSAVNFILSILWLRFYNSLFHEEVWT